MAWICPDGADFHKELVVHLQSCRLAEQGVHVEQSVTLSVSLLPSLSLFFLTYQRERIRVLPALSPGSHTPFLFHLSFLTKGG